MRAFTGFLWVCEDIDLQSWAYWFILILTRRILSYMLFYVLFLYLYNLEPIRFLQTGLRMGMWSFNIVCKLTSYIHEE